jgi:uncharacterized protein (UPF0335 family)
MRNHAQDRILDAEERAGHPNLSNRYSKLRGWGMASAALAMADVANTGVAADELRQFVERIERLEEEKAGIAGDIREVFAEMKGRGFDTKAVRSILRLRKKDAAERQEEEAVLDLYMQALGMA